MPHGTHKHPGAVLLTERAIAHVIWENCGILCPVISVQGPTTTRNPTADSKDPSPLCQQQTASPPEGMAEEQVSAQVGSKLEGATPQACQARRTKQRRQPLAVQPAQGSLSWGSPSQQHWTVGL